MKLIAEHDGLSTTRVLLRNGSQVVGHVPYEALSPLLGAAEQREVVIVDAEEWARLHRYARETEESIH